MNGILILISLCALQEFMLDPAVDPVGASDKQFTSSSAFDGTNCFVVWEDHRTLDDWDIYGARLTPAGIVPDTNGIAIAATPAEQRDPSVAFGGANYLAVWQDGRNGNLDIYGARIAPSGSVLDPSGIPIAATAETQGQPAAAFDGSNYLVVWSEGETGSCDIHGAFVSPAGAVLDQIVVSAAENGQTNPAVAFDGVNYLVAWEDGRYGGVPCIFFSRVGVDGTILDPNGISLSSGYHPDIAFGDSLYLITWLAVQGLENFTYVARVRPDGTALDPAGFPIFTGDLMLHWPSVAYNGTNFLVVSPWQYGALYGQRVTPAGTVLDPGGVKISEGAYPFVYAEAVYTGTGCLVDWSDWRNGCFPQYSDIYAARVTPAMGIADPDGILISTAVDMQTMPAVSGNGTGFLAVWTEGYLNSGADIKGVTIGPGGTPDSHDFLAARGPDGMYSQYQGAVGFGGSNYFAAWSSEDPASNGSVAIYGTRVTPAGDVLDGDSLGIVSGTGPEYYIHPQVAFDGNNYLVAYEHDYLNNDTSIIMAAFISQDGVLLDNLSIWISHNGAPAVAFGASKYLVVWPEKRDVPDLEICGALVTPAGMLTPIWDPIISAPGNQALPQIAYDGAGYLLVWQDDRNGNNDIYGARVNQSGIALDPGGFPIAAAPGDQGSPAVTFDGVNYVVVWQDLRAGDNYDIYGARISPSGTVLDSAGVELVNGAADRRSPRIARGSGSQFLLVFQGFVPGDPYRTDRVFGAFGGTWGIEDDPSAGRTKSEILSLTAYPNPFRGRVTLGYLLPGRGEAGRIRIYNGAGRLVKSLEPEAGIPNRPARAVWDGSDDRGRAAPAGIYFVHLEAGGRETIEKVTLLR